MRFAKSMAWGFQNEGPTPKVFAMGAEMLAIETYLLLTGSQTSIWRVRAPLLTVLWPKVGTALQGRLLRLRPLNGLAATGAVGQDTMEAVRAAIVPRSANEEPRIPEARGEWECKALYGLRKSVDEGLSSFTPLVPLLTSERRGSGFALTPLRQPAAHTERRMRTKLG